MTDPRLRANLPTQGAVPAADGSWRDAQDLVRHLETQVQIARSPEARVVCRTHLHWPAERAAPLAVGAPWHAVWRPPQSRWSEALGCAALCPVTAIRLHPEGSDFCPVSADLDAVQGWLSDLQVHAPAYVVAGFPQRDGDTVHVPLTLWLPRLWLHGGAPLQVAAVLDRRQPPEQLMAEILALLGCLQDEPAALPAPGQSEPVSAADVEGAIATLRAGDLDKLVVGWASRWQSDASVAQVLARLRRERHDAWVMAWSPPPDAPDGPQVCCASPELLVRTDTNRVETLALAGTLPDGCDPADASLAHFSREHQLVIDHLRRALVRLGAEPQQQPTVVRRAGPLHHLATAISAARPPGLDAWTAALHLHPTPALLGSPRAAALDALARHESAKRSWYGGFAGVLMADGSGTGELAVILRAACQASGTWTAWAGAGLVADTHADLERREIISKHAAIGAMLGLGPAAGTGR